MFTYGCHIGGDPGPRRRESTTPSQGCEGNQELPQIHPSPKKYLYSFTKIVIYIFYPQCLTNCTVPNSVPVHYESITIVRYVLTLVINTFQHCFICCPSYSTVSEDAGIDAKTVVTSALAVKRSNH